MDDHTYNNWVKIKTTFEESGNTNNMFGTSGFECAHGFEECRTSGGDVINNDINLFPANV